MYANLTKEKKRPPLPVRARRKLREEMQRGKKKVDATLYLSKDKKIKVKVSILSPFLFKSSQTAVLYDRCNEGFKGFKEKADR